MEWHLNPIKSLELSLDVRAGSCVDEWVEDCKIIRGVLPIPIKLVTQSGEIHIPQYIQPFLIKQTIQDELKRLSESESELPQL